MSATETQQVRLSVTGMTCEHCVKHVKTELNALANVTAVEVKLEPQGTSLVTAATCGEVTDEELREAVDEAGYDLDEIAR